MPAALALFVAIDVATPESMPGAVVFTFVPVAVVCTLLGLVLRRAPRSIYAVAPISLLLAVLGGAVGTGYGLRHPESFFDFSTNLIMLAAPTVGFFASLAAIRRRIRHTPGATPTHRQARAVLAIAGVVSVAVGTSGLVTLITGPTVVRAGTPAEVVTVHDRFLPQQFAVVRGERVRFRVRNEDTYAHRFSVDEAELDDFIGPLARVTITMDVPKTRAKRIRLYCSVSGHESMVGEIFLDPS
jgi:uncharacterized cupredoxin-like copper-binding protein